MKSTAPHQKKEGAYSASGWAGGRALGGQFPVPGGHILLGWLPTHQRETWIWGVQANRHTAVVHLEGKNCPRLGPVNNYILVLSSCYNKVPWTCGKVRDRGTVLMSSSPQRPCLLLPSLWGLGFQTELRGMQTSNHSSEGAQYRLINRVTSFYIKHPTVLEMYHLFLSFQTTVAHNLRCHVLSSSWVPCSKTLWCAKHGIGLRLREPQTTSWG